jgi:ankyrin repeat protein
MTIKKTVLLMTCMAIVFVLQTASAREAVAYKDKQIEELSGKFFYYSNADGTESLTLAAAPGDDWNAFITDCCQNTLAQLTSESAALSIPGTSLILAFLACPITNDVQRDSVVAFFDRNNLNVPLCFSQLALMPSGSYYYGSVTSLELRKARNGAFYLVVTLGGADGGDFWTSFLFLHIDMNCTITLLSKLYAGHGMNHDEENPGREIACHFVDDKTVEVTTNHLVLTDQFDEKTVKTTSERFNLEDLYNNPQSRVFPSEAEKSLVLLKSGRDPNFRDKNGKTLFTWIAEGLLPWVVKASLNKDVDINAKTKDGYTVLMAAAAGGHPEVLTMLLNKGADVNAKDDNGWTALMTAARTHSSEALKVLLDDGANVNARDDNGWTALMTAAMTAARTGSLQSVELLLDKGADVNARTKRGLTALMTAANKATYTHESVVELLIERGADVNAKDDEGKTALMSAARAKGDHVDLVKLLIEKGADVNSKSSGGDTALKVAKKEGQTQIVELLKAHGAKE